MKIETYNNLINELNSNEYSNDHSIYNVKRLFKIYTETEITHFQDLFNTSLAQDFKDFIISNLHNFRGISKDEGAEVYETELMLIRASAQKRSFPLTALNSTRFYRKSQESFVKDVEKIIGESKPKILEVGSGQVPYSSFLLAKDNAGEISTMDKFVLSNKTIENLNCRPYDEYFISSTNIKYYDFVVANKACLAIEPIVRHCKEEKKPYFMKLCTCEAPGGTMEGWHEYLKHIDPQIQFADKDYAFNLDM